MKRVFLSIIATAALFVGCNADVDVEVTRPIAVNAPTFSASFDAETRTSYEENQGYAKWIENEHLSIFNLDNHNLKYYIHNVGNNGKTADMDYAEEYVEKSGDILDQNYAIYPYSEANEAANGMIYSEIPAVQTYDAESNFKNVPIVACSPDTSLSFSIPTAIYRYKVKKQNHPSKFILKSITMTSKSTNIAGAIEIDMTAEKPVAVVTGDGKSVTLDLGEGVEITTTEQYFYIALPATSFPANDRTITCLVSKGGKDYQVVIEKENEMTLEAGIVKSTSIELKATSFTANSVYPSTGGELVGTLTLTSDFTLEQSLTVPAGEEATVNLNGHNITNTSDSDIEYFDIFYVEEGATLTINGDGNVEAVSGIEGYCVFAEGNVIINGGSYKSGIDAAGDTNACIYAKTNGNITINGGEFESADGTFVLNLYDSSRDTASIIVKGGKFYNFDPANNAAEGEGTNFVADGYISVEVEENVWEVMPANQPIEVASAAALEDVLAQGGSAVLADDIAIEKSLVIADGMSATLDLNGNDITVNTDSNELGEGDAIIVYGDLTINGEGTVTGNTRAVWARGTTGATITINGGTYVGSTTTDANSEVIYASGDGKIVINGGDFSATNTSSSFAAPQYAVLNLHGNGKDGANITVYGGTFHNFDPANNISENPAQSFVAEGYISVETSEGIWEVMPATEPVEVATAAALEDVLAQGGSAVLAANITLEQSLTVPAGEEAIVNLNGHNITNTSDSDIEFFDIFYVEEGATLTINGDGNVEAVSGIEGYCVFAEGDVIINGGYFKSGIDTAGKTNACIYAKTNGNITINGGEFESADGTFVLNLYDSSRDTASIIVKGGKFYNFDPANNEADGAGTNYVAEGYISVEVEENVWEVMPANQPIEVATASALKSALAQGGDVKLSADIVVEGPDTYNGGDYLYITESANIDLNGKTLSYTGADRIFYAKGEGVVVTINATNGGKIYVNPKAGVDASTTAGYIASTTDGAMIIVNGGEFEVEGCTTFQSTNGWIEINGGSFKANENYTTTGKYEYKYTLNCNDNNYKNGNAGFVVNGGSFYKFDPANNAAEGVGTSFLAEGKTSTADGDWYIVK